jgi:hypothetical protein
MVSDFICFLLAKLRKSPLPTKDEGENFQSAPIQLVTPKVVRMAVRIAMTV